MMRPPRAPSESPFSRPRLTYAVAQGLGFACILLFAYGLLASIGGDVAQSRTSVFIALILGVFLLTLANRDVSRSVLVGAPATNPWILRMLGGVLLMLALVLGVPWLRTMMGLALPHAHTLMFSALMLLASVFWLEGLRLATRSLRARTQALRVPGKRR